VKNLLSFPVEPDIGQDYEGWARWQSFEVPCCRTEQGHRILVDRRPPWLRQLAERYLDWHCWHAAWRLVADSLVPRLETASYLHTMAASAGAPLHWLTWCDAIRAARSLTGKYGQLSDRRRPGSA
jgi:hypothetical protein